MVPGNASFRKCSFNTVDKARSSFALTRFCISVFGVKKLEDKGDCQRLLAQMHGARPCPSVSISITAPISIQHPLTCWTAAGRVCVCVIPEEV